jgi:hypothetical protein
MLSAIPLSTCELFSFQEARYEVAVDRNVVTAHDLGFNEVEVELNTGHCHVDTLAAMQM